MPASPSPRTLQSLLGLNVQLHEAALNLFTVMTALLSVAHVRASADGKPRPEPVVPVTPVLVQFLTG